uniref:Ig-like domain-containing protein n=1 Tax=Oryzias latipes TaxID=8090 RepID=A0A3B3I390_ORYLA
AFKLQFIEMTTKTRPTLFFQFFVLFFAPNSCNLNDFVFLPHLGQDAVLSCQVEPPFDLTAETLEWKHGTEDVHVFRSLGDDPDNQDPRFKGRTILNRQNLKDGNVSLTLTNFTKKDEGNYSLCLRTQTPFMCSNVTLTKSKLLV